MPRQRNPFASQNPQLERHLQPPQPARLAACSTQSIPRCRKFKFYLITDGILMFTRPLDGAVCCWFKVWGKTSVASHSLIRLGIWLVKDWLSLHSCKVILTVQLDVSNPVHFIPWNYVDFFSQMLTTWFWHVFLGGKLTSCFSLCLQTEKWQPLPSVIFGALGLVSGCLAFLLPETKNRNLPSTVEEAENRDRLVTALTRIYSPSPFRIYYKMMIFV